MVFSDVVDFNGINRTINLSVWVLYRLWLAQLHGKCYRCRKLVPDPWMPCQSIKEDTHQLHSTDVRFRRKRVSACYVPLSASYHRSSRVPVCVCMCLCVCVRNPATCRQTHGKLQHILCALCGATSRISAAATRWAQWDSKVVSRRAKQKDTDPFGKPNGKLKTEKTRRWANTNA